MAVAQRKSRSWRGYLKSGGGQFCQSDRGDADKRRFGALLSAKSWSRFIERNGSCQSDRVIRYSYTTSDDWYHDHSQRYDGICSCELEGEPSSTEVEECIIRYETACRLHEDGGIHRRSDHWWRQSGFKEPVLWIEAIPFVGCLCQLWHRRGPTVGRFWRLSYGSPEYPHRIGLSALRRQKYERCDSWNNDGRAFGTEYYFTDRAALFEWFYHPHSWTETANPTFRNRPVRPDLLGTRKYPDDRTFIRQL